jgi:hypothetical protein
VIWNWPRWLSFQISETVINDYACECLRSNRSDIYISSDHLWIMMDKSKRINSIRPIQ